VLNTRHWRRENMMKLKLAGGGSLLTVVFLIVALLLPAGGLNARWSGVPRTNLEDGPELTWFEMEGCTIKALSPAAAAPGEEVSVYGWGFGGDPGYVVLSGLKIDPVAWSDKKVTFPVPGDGYSGNLYIRTSGQVKSNDIGFSVERELPDGQYEPWGGEIGDTGLLGPAFLVETDGSGLYCLSGFETLSTYELAEEGPHEYRGQVQLPQRVGELNVFDGYLFIAGDHGLYIFETEHLRSGGAEWAAAVACGNCFSVDVRYDGALPGSGLLVALSEHRPAAGSDQLRVHLYRFESGELLRLGPFTRTVAPAERQTAIVLDPLNPKAYVAGFETFFGYGKYLLEIDISDLYNPVLNHREDLGRHAIYDMDAIDDLLWATAMFPETESFQAFRLLPGADHFYLDMVIDTETTTNRVRVVSDSVTVGSSWFGSDPNVFLWNTFNPVDFPDPAVNTLDWAFDVTGFAEPVSGYDGRIFVADEWGGFLTYYYEEGSPPVIHSPEGYQQLPSGAWSHGLFIKDDRIYLVGRGSGPWSANRFDLADRDEWRYVEWDWTDEHPQPVPITSIWAKEEPGLGTVIVAGGHDEAFDWGDKACGLLYHETGENLEPVAMSEVFNPPGEPPLFGCMTDIDWSEDDLVYMTTGPGGFRAFIVSPWEPSITLHDSCRTRGFAADDFGVWRYPTKIARCSDGGDQKILISANANLLGGVGHGLYVYGVDYPEGVPDRNDPGRPISIEKENHLECLLWAFVPGMKVTPSGLVGLATTKGALVFHVSWVETLNSMFTWKALDHIEIPVENFEPWDPSWDATFTDIAFGDDNTVYVIREELGVWRFAIEIDWEDHSHTSVCTGFYPAVECGSDWTTQMPGWGDPDIPTLHNPQIGVAVKDTLYTTGWSGKIRRLDFD